MSRPPVIPAQDKVRVVLSVLAGEVTVAEAARRSKVSETAVGNWKRQFLESGALGSSRRLGQAIVSGAGARGSGRGADHRARRGPCRAAGVEEVSRAPVGPSRTSSDSHRGGHVDREVLQDHRPTCPSGPGSAGKPARGRRFR